MGTDKARQTSDHKRKMKVETVRKTGTAGRSIAHDKPAERRTGSSDQLTAL